MHDMVILSLILVAAIGLFVTQWVRLEITSIGILFALGITGLLPNQDIFSGFSSSATLTVAAMLILSKGIEQAGAMDLISRLLAQWSRGSRYRLLIAMWFGVSLFSAFVNNTPVVALMIPAVLSIAPKINVSPSKLLIPLSYFSILGGTCTILGTSTNILADSLYREYGYAGFGIFDLTRMGLVYLLIGGVYILIFSGKLPDRTSFSQLLDLSKRSSFMTEVRVPKSSPLLGNSLAQICARLEKTRIIELVRREEVFLGPDPSMILEEGDQIFIEGSAKDLHILIDNQNLEYGTGVADGERVLLSNFKLSTVEAVITPNSQYRQLKINEAGLNRTYGIKVLALRRLGREHKYKLREMRLQSGDVLLIQGEIENLQRFQESGDALLIEGVQDQLVFPKRAPLALAILGLVIAAASLTSTPIVVAALGGVLAMLLSRCLSLREATQSLDSSVLLLLAGSIPLGKAIETTGMAKLVAEWLLDVSGGLNPIVIVSIAYLLTSILTEVMSNNAAVVLLLPIVLNIATHSGVNPNAMVAAIMFGASASFATPIGYQCNAMVMGPGGYKFRDFLYIGIPMNIIMWIVATIFIPIFWPLTA